MIGDKFSPYSETEDAHIRRAYRAGQDVTAAATALGRSPWGVAQRAADLGLGRFWIRDMKKLAMRARRQEDAQVAPADEIEVGSLTSNFRVTSVYRNGGSEIQERAFYHDAAETVEAIASLAPAVMGANLAWHSVSQRKYLGGGAWRWEDAAHLVERVAA